MVGLEKETSLNGDLGSGMTDKNQKLDVVHWPVPTPTCVYLVFL